MALSDEQNAMLRLLASGEQGYGDIAALMGLSEEDVRAKVVGALAQLQAEGKPVPDIPPPVAGGAKPAAAVAPEPVAPAKPEPTAKEEPPAEPAAAASVAPKEPATPAPPLAPPPADPPPSGGRTVTLPSGPKAWVLGGLLLAVIVVAVVVVLIVTSGGSDSNSSTSAGEGTATTAAETGGEAGAAEKSPTQARLTAVDGSAAEGLATFGRIKRKLALQIEATGLEPTTEGTDAYTIWLAQTPQKMLPLASTGVKGSGKGAGTIAAEFEVPVEVLAYLANGTFDQIEITRTKTAPLEASLKRATQTKKTPVYTGTPVLRGTITGPIVGLAKREKTQGE